MHGLLMRASATALLAYLSPQIAASPVYRCANSEGHITFTHHDCPAGQQQHLQNALNATPSNGPPTLMAREPPSRTSRTEKQGNLQEVVVIGQQDDGCGNHITGRDRREAMIRKEIRSGMPRADVESTLGKPDRISSRNGRTSYYYRSNAGHTRQIDFDEHNCVSIKSRK